MRENHITIDQVDADPAEMNSSVVSAEMKFRIKLITVLCIIIL